MNMRYSRTGLNCLVLFAPLLLAVGFASAAEERINFISHCPDDDYRAADRALREFLKQGVLKLDSDVEIEFEPMSMNDYSAAIHAVADPYRDSDAYVARLTPYAFVVAEMLGADFEILATYKSKATNRFTYHSYFVVNRDDFTDGKPELEDIEVFLSEDTPEFIYHDKFSTSSYLLPAHYFRQRMNADVQESGGAQKPIKIDPELESMGLSSSSELVEAIANGEAGIAAVWDGTMKKFEPGGQSEETGNKVYFVKLPQTLPSDLLVCSSKLKPKLRRDLLESIRGMTEDSLKKDSSRDSPGDFLLWSDIREQTEAREALASLRDLAAPAKPLVTMTIEVRSPESSKGSVDLAKDYKKAAKAAVRLSGTEFTIRRKDYHRQADIEWTIEPLHDGAIKITSKIKDSPIEAQVFRLSFTDVKEDLVVRIGEILQSRMHRIRYLWAYEDEDPTVIRDVLFALPEGSQVWFQELTWINLEKHDFDADEWFSATIKDSNFYRFQIDKEAPGLPWVEKPEGGRRLNLNPMGNVAYRVVLLRQPEEGRTLDVLVISLVTLLVIGGALGAYDLVRRTHKTPQARPTES